MYKQNVMTCQVYIGSDLNPLEWERNLLPNFVMALVGSSMTPSSSINMELTYTLQVTNMSDYRSDQHSPWHQVFA